VLSSAPERGSSKVAESLLSLLLVLLLLLLVLLLLERLSVPRVVLWVLAFGGWIFGIFLSRLIRRNASFAFSAMVQLWTLGRLVSPSA
jgi:hypothetical protein